MNRAENIESYIQTNLRGKVNARPKYFLRMLRAVETGDYHPLRVTAHAKKNYHLLMRQPTEMNINILDSEPVPYEKLWEMVMEILEGFRKSKGRKATNQPRLRTVKKLANKNS